MANVDYSVLITLLIKIVAAIASILVTALLPKVRSWVTNKISEQQLEQIIKYVKMFVESAEQQLKVDDPTGAKRKAYVIEQLGILGIEVSQQIDAIIESQVLLLNKKIVIEESKD